MTKRCRKCDTVKPLAGFSNDKSRKDGVSCHRKYDRSREAIPA